MSALQLSISSLPDGSITGLSLGISKEDCASTEVRPCYERQTAKKSVILNQESGTKAFAACLKSASPSQRGESVRATSICTDEIYYYCNEGVSNIIIKKFNGNCETVPPVKVIYPNGGEELVQGRYSTVNDRVHWEGELYDLKFSGGREKFQIILVKEEAMNNADPTNLVVGYIIESASLPFPIGTGYGDIYPGYGGNSFTDPTTGVHLLLDAWNPLSVCGASTGWSVGCYAVQPGKYKILVLSENEKGQLLLWDSAANKPGNWDLSDQPFSIVASS